MNSKIKIAIVASRFAEIIPGGAEKHALKFALLLSEKYDVTVLTTTAIDYKTWKNELKTGATILQGINVIRFPVDKKRDLKSFNKFFDKIRQRKLEWSNSNMDIWIDKQGPVSLKLINYIRENKKTYDLFFFISYLYFPTVKGIQIVKNKSICLTTLHDELPAYFPIYKKIFTNEIFYCFNTIEELNLFQEIFGYTPANHTIIGVNIDLPEIDNSKKIIQRMPNSEIKELSKIRYAIYLGRDDGGKGITELKEFFLEWINRYSQDLKLVFVGGGSKYQEEGILSTGYLIEEDKDFLLKNALFLINPSTLESFSMVIMEAWANKIPVIVNEQSDVMKGHCIRSNGGLYYRDKESFFMILNYLLTNEPIRKKLAENGNRYVFKNYSTEIVKMKLYSFIKDKLHPTL